MKRACLILFAFALLTVAQQTSVVKTVADVTMTGSAQVITPGVPTYGHWVVFQCPTANTGTIYLGDASVSTTRGAGCAAGGYAFWPPSGPVYDLSQHYAVGTSGDKLKISYQSY